MGINDTSIDELNIVEEVFAIGNRVDSAMKEVHEPKRIYDDKKTYVKHLRGKIWLEYKTGKRTVEGMDKLTDKAIDSAVEADLEYLEAQKEVNKAYHDYMVASDWADAMEGKKKGLELVSKFVLGQWFSDLKVASIGSIQNFANGGSVNKERSVVEEREALRERKRRRAKEKEGKEEEID